MLWASAKIGLYDDLDEATQRTRAIDLGKSDQITLTGELAGTVFGSADAKQLHATAGLSWAVYPHLDLSVVGLVGLLAGGDRYGFLVGAEPKLQLFRR